MPYILKPKFEQHRTSLIRKNQPMRERDIVPLQDALEKGLDGLPGLLVEKIRRMPHPDGLLEISAKYLGLDADQETVVKMLRFEFPEETLNLENHQFWVGESDEAVLLMFAGRNGDRYLTGRLLVTF